MRTDRFLVAALLGACFLGGSSSALRAAPVRRVDQPPVLITNVAPGVILVDFGKVAFGNLRLSAPSGTTNAVTVHFGEAQLNGRVHRQPPGTVRYAKPPCRSQAPRTSWWPRHPTSATPNRTPPMPPRPSSPPPSGAWCCRSAGWKSKAGPANVAARTNPPAGGLRRDLGR